MSHSGPRVLRMDFIWNLLHNIYTYALGLMVAAVLFEALREATHGR